MFNQCPGLAWHQLSQIASMSVAPILSRHTCWRPMGHCQRTGTVCPLIRGPHRSCRVWSWCCPPCAIIPVWLAGNAPTLAFDPCAVSSDPSPVYPAESAVPIPFIAGPNYLAGVVSSSLPLPPELPVWLQSPTWLPQELICSRCWIPGCCCSPASGGFSVPFNISLLWLPLSCVQGISRYPPVECLTPVFSCNLPVLYLSDDSLSSRTCLHPVSPSRFLF